MSISHPGVLLVHPGVIFCPPGVTIGSHLFTNEEVFLLHRLRSRNVNLKVNFKSKYKYSDLECVLGCEEEESQQHLMNCKYILEKLPSSSQTEVQYEDLFGSVSQQKTFITFYSKLLDIRQQLLPDDE